MAPSVYSKPISPWFIFSQRIFSLPYSVRANPIKIIIIFKEIYLINPGV